MPYATYPSRTPPAAHLYADHRQSDQDSGHAPPRPQPPPHIKRPSSPGSPSIFSSTPTPSPTSPSPSPASAVHADTSASSSSVSPNSTSKRSSLLATSARLTYLSALFATVLCALLNLVLASYVVKLARDGQRIAQSTRVSVRRARMLVEYWSRKWRVVGVVKRVVPWPVVWVVGWLVRRSRLAARGRGVASAAGAARGGKG